MYENKKLPLVPSGVFYARFWKNAGVAFILLMICLLVGISCYK